MKHRDFVTAILIVLVLSVVALPAGRSIPTAIAQSQPPAQNLFADAPVQPDSPPLDSNPSGASWVVRSRFLTVNHDVLSAQTSQLTLNLFPDASYQASLESSTILDPEDPGRFIWRGALDGIANGSVTLAVNGPSIAATVSLPDALYRVSDTGQDLHLVQQTTLQDPMPEEPPVPVSEEGSEEGSEAQGIDAMSPADDGSIIDVWLSTRQLRAPSMALAASSP
jgi:hypothetical protein